MKSIDLIVAVRNEEQSLPGFVSRLEALQCGPEVSLGVVFVEDGSTDRTRELLRDMATKNPRIKYIFLAQGFGQAPAIALGIAHSKADAVIMMDVDGGHPLDVIPQMVHEYLNGASAVQAVRRRIVERSRYRDLGTKVFNRAYRLLTGIDTNRQNVYFRLVSRDLFQSLLRNRRWTHFLRINYRGLQHLKVSYVEFEAAERTFGVSKYNLKRLIAFAWIATLSSMSGVRFCLLGVVAAVVASTFVAAGVPIVPWLIAVLIAGSAWQFVRLSTVDVLQRFTIVEAAL